jgi:hypothetical protein
MDTDCLVKDDTGTAMLSHAPSPCLRGTVLSAVCQVLFWKYRVTSLECITSYHSSEVAFIMPRNLTEKPSLN